MKLNYAKANSLDAAQAVVFGANIQGAGISQSFIGQSLRPTLPAPHLFSADAIRAADNESPSLPDNLRLGDQLFDSGNLDVDGLSKGEQLDQVTRCYASLFSQRKFAIGLGGDHLIKYAALSALHQEFPNSGIVYIDAHPDCQLTEAVAYNSILHHAFQLPGIFPARTSIVGLRQITELEAQGLKKWSPHVIRSTEFAATGMPAVVHKIEEQLHQCETIYLSIDLDGLDPSSAPAVEAPYPGRPMLHDLIWIVQSLAKRYKIVGMDISEHLPQLDPFKLTALSASRLFKEAYSVTETNVLAT